MLLYPTLAPLFALVVTAHLCCWFPPASVLAEAVCLQPRLDLRSHDRGAIYSSKGDAYKGVVAISCHDKGDDDDDDISKSCIVARNRHGIYRLDYLMDDSDSDSSLSSQQHHRQAHRVRPLGDHFGYDMLLVELADHGNVVAVATNNYDVSLLHLQNDTDLSLTQIVAHSLKDSIPGMEASTGGLALNGNGTILATSLFVHGQRNNNIGIFRLDHDMKTNMSHLTGSGEEGSFAQPIELIPNAAAKTLVLAPMGDVLIAADDTCDVDSENKDMARLRIYRRHYNGTAFDWDLELDIWGISQPCTSSWAYTGVSVATNQDGSLVAVGAFNNQTNTSAVSVFEYNSNNLDQDPTGSGWMIRDTIETGDNNRTFVSLSADGNWLAVGTPTWNNTNYTDSDRITLLQYNNSKAVWETVARVSGEDGKDNFLLGATLGNGIAMDDNATVLAVGHSKTHLRVYDIVHSCDEPVTDIIVPSFPTLYNYSICEDEAITINSSSPVFHLGLSGTLLGFEDSFGFDQRDTSVVKLYDIGNWSATPIDVGVNFTHFNNQDVIVSANGTMAAVLTKGDTDDDPDIIRVFRLSSKYAGAGLGNVAGDVVVASVSERKRNIFRRDDGTALTDDDGDKVQEIASIEGGKFEAAYPGIAFNGDGTVIVAAVHTFEGDGRRRVSNYAVQAYSLLDDESAWVPLGGNISLTSPEGQFSLSKSDLVLAVGDSMFGDVGVRQGQLRILQFQDSEWKLQAEFNGTEGWDRRLGFSVSTNADGTIVAAGALAGRDSYGVTHVGSVHVYHNSDETGGWRLRERLSVGNRGDTFGYSVALSGDGSLMAVGSFPPITERRRSQVRLFEYDATIGRWGLLFSDKGYSITGTTIQQFWLGQSVAFNEDSSLMATGSAAPNNRRPPAPDHVRVYNLSSCLAPTSSAASGATSNFTGRESDSNSSEPASMNITSGSTPAAPAAQTMLLWIGVGAAVCGCLLF